MKLDRRLTSQSMEVSSDAHLGANELLYQPECRKASAVSLVNGDSGGSTAHSAEPPAGD